MVRRTKEEALATRSRILDAAEQRFLAHGVAGTSLQDIATAAGVTRGAVYWHFQDKADLFNAMMSRVCLPMEEAAARLTPDAASPPLATLRGHLLEILARVTGDEQVRRVFEIATQRVEYVGELVSVRERHRQMRGEHVAMIERLLQAAQQRGDVVTALPARALALSVHALLDGLIQNWMLDPASFDLQRDGACAIDLHLAGLRAGVGGAAG